MPVKRPLCALLALLLCLPLTALAKDAIPVTMRMTPYQAEFSFSIPDQEYVYVTYDTRFDTGEMVLYAPDGNFSGVCCLPGSGTAMKMGINVYTLAGKALVRDGANTVADPNPPKPAAGLEQMKAVNKITDMELVPQADGVHYRFTLPGRDSVVIRYSSPQEKHTVTVCCGADYVYKGVLTMPYTYADDNVTVTVLTVGSSNQLYQETVKAYYQPPEVIEKAAEGRLSGVTVCIDPGHQRQTQVETVPLGPNFNSTTTSTVGMAQGVITGRRESQGVLEIGHLLRNALLAEGADVVMTREVQDTFVGMLERADIPNDAGADFVLRLHINYRSDNSIQGIQVYCPLSSSYAQEVADEDTYRVMGTTLLDAMKASTGVTKGNCTLNNTYVGNNWSKMPSFLVEMGYMSNRTEDLKLACPHYQMLLVQGMVEGLVKLSQLRGLIDK